MDSFENKIITFLAALQDVYREEEERDLLSLPAMELKEESLTEDFTAMIYAMSVLYREITGDEVDIIEFTHICNRLVFQQIMKDKEK